MFKKCPIAAVLAATTSIVLFMGGCAAQAEKPAATAAAAKPAAPAKPDYTKMTPEALAEYIIMESGSYDLAQPTQEGTTGKDRLVQDEIQKICSQVARSGKEIDAKTADKVVALAQATLKYPEGGIKLGDWKKGRDIAWSGFGFRTAHNVDDHSRAAPGGNCYNCHQLATDRTGGNLGPSLTGYGKLRGTSPEMLKYTYEVIYNPHSYFACTSMPRIGAKGVLTQQQIADVMAYLFDPESPVNK
jgi:sulfur-oxidizing protein SoxX